MTTIEVSADLLGVASMLLLIAVLDRPVQLVINGALDLGRRRTQDGDSHEVTYACGCSVHDGCTCQLWDRR